MMRSIGVYDSNDMNDICDICAMNDTQKNYSSCYPAYPSPETFVAYFFKNIENPLKTKRSIFQRIEWIFADRNKDRLLELYKAFILDNSSSKLRKIFWRILAHMSLTFSRGVLKWGV